jgi:flavin reductase (DIM6/NTAB) family NADH-FMN oxidoreductase RutF
MEDMSQSTNGMSDSSAFDVREFRRALGAFVTGVTVVTTIEDGRPRGFTANSFTSVSLDPPLVLVCIGKSSSNLAAFSSADRFAINILSDQQRDVSRNFASKVEDRFAAVDWRKGQNGTPIINATAAWFECDMHRQMDAGDHIILIGEVRFFGHDTLSPLGFCRGNYVLFQLEQDVVASKSGKTKVGALLETPDGILLVRDGQTNRLHLPRANKIGSRETHEGLYGKLATFGLSFDLDFLYSVYDDEGTGTLNVYYRGQASGDVGGDSVVLAPLGAIPYEELEDDALRMLLSRYVEERAEFRFSVYSGNADKGRLWGLDGSQR